MDGARVRALGIADGALLVEGRSDADGRAVLQAPELRGAVTIEVEGAATTQLWMGVRTDELVLALPAEEPREVVAAEVRGIPAAWGAARIDVGTATHVSLLRTGSLARAATVPCAVGGVDGCAVELVREEADATLAVATVAGPSDRVAGFVVGTLGAAGGTLSTPIEAAELALTLPETAELTEIIGVPGIARQGALVLLPQPPGDPSRLAVPRLDALAVTDRYWVFVEGHPFRAGGDADPNARSVLFARGARDAAELPRWPSWLGTPSASIGADGAASFEAVSGADVHVVDWIDGDGAIVASAWLLDPTLLSVEALRPGRLDLVERAATVRVRALDTLAPGPDGFEVGELEARVERFAERTLDGP